MDNALDIARQEYKSYFDSKVYPLLGLSRSDLDDFGFVEIALRIEDPIVQRQYRRLAIGLLEESLREHQLDRPSILELIDAGNLMEFHDWQDVLFTWEKAVSELASHGAA